MDIRIGAFLFEQVGPCHYRLPKEQKWEQKKPIDFFLSEELLSIVEPTAVQQAITAANFEGVVAVKVMPDTHQGYGVPIGVVIVTDDTILPTAAGYDIGCGMVQLRSSLTADQVADKTKRRQWIEKVTGGIGVGVGQPGKGIKKANFEDIVRYGGKALGRTTDSTERNFIPVEEKVDAPAKALEKATQLGSLGGGNHFCEMQIEDGTNRVWVMIHTGSRGYGHSIANDFFCRGAELLGLPKKDRELAWFRRDSKIGREYWALHNMAANFAIANRVMIGEAVCRALEEVFGGEAEVFYEISHNLIQQEGQYLVHRKGTTRAFPKGHPSLEGTKWVATGHPILIPGSMQTGSAILYAEAGAEKSAYSVNHGSGRLMSRGQASRTLDQGLIDRQMAEADILINTRNTPLDESGPCYKDLNQVLATIEMAGLAKVAHRLRPTACIKGND